MNIINYIFEKKAGKALFVILVASFSFLLMEGVVNFILYNMDMWGGGMWVSAGKIMLSLLLFPLIFGILIYHLLTIFLSYNSVLEYWFQYMVLFGYSLFLAYVVLVCVKVSRQYRNVSGINIKYSRVLLYVVLAVTYLLLSVFSVKYLQYSGIVPTLGIMEKGILSYPLVNYGETQVDGKYNVFGENVFISGSLADSHGARDLNIFIDKDIESIYILFSHYSRCFSSPCHKDEGEDVGVKLYEQGNTLADSRKELFYNLTYDNLDKVEYVLEMNWMFLPEYKIKFIVHWLEHKDFVSQKAEALIEQASVNPQNFLDVSLKFNENGVYLVFTNKTELQFSNVKLSCRYSGSDYYGREKIFVLPEAIDGFERDRVIPYPMNLHDEEEEDINISICNIASAEPKFIERIKNN